MVKKFIFFSGNRVVFFQGYAMANELIDDVKQAREKNNSLRLDVSNVVSEHINKNSLWSEISDRLIKDGFECYARPAQKTDSNSIIYDCILDLRPWYKLGFGDQLRLYILVKNDKVIVSSGELVYLSL